MSQFLDLARTWLKRAEEASFVEQEVERMRYAIGSIVAHLSRLEEFQPQPPSESREIPPHRHDLVRTEKGNPYMTGLPWAALPIVAPASESSSLPDIVTPEGMKPTSVILSSWFCPANPDGTLMQSQLRVIWDSLSSTVLAGSEQGVVIGVTLTSRAATQPSGSASSSPAEAVSQGNGHVGEKWPPSENAERECAYEWLHTDNNWYKCRYLRVNDTDRCRIHQKRDIFPDRPAVGSYDD